jgi:hypothetical protein
MQSYQMPSNLSTPHFMSYSGSDFSGDYHALSTGPLHAGKNAAAVLATEIPAGHLSLAVQLGGGNPGLPEKGSLMYQDLVNRGLIHQGQ